MNVTSAVEMLRAYAADSKEWAEDAGWVPPELRDRVIEALENALPDKQHTLEVTNWSGSLEAEKLFRDEIDVAETVLAELKALRSPLPHYASGSHGPFDPATAPGPGMRWRLEENSDAQIFLLRDGEAVAEICAGWPHPAREIAAEILKALRGEQ